MGSALFFGQRGTTPSENAINLQRVNPVTKRWQPAKLINSANK
jgi:hypothetical protein